MTDKPVSVSFELTHEEALALAQFVKRVGFSDLQEQAVNEAETYLMSDAIHRLRKGLDEAGYSPH